MTKLSMHEHLPSEDASAPPPVVSTGDLPDRDQVEECLKAAYERYRTEQTGSVADYIPALARARRDLFGLAVVGVAGNTFGVGDDKVLFSIQSVSKPFVFALICEALGHEQARLQLGVNSTGLPFNSVMAIELNDDRTMNPLVNAGAIAATSLVPGDTADAKWARVLRTDCPGSPAESSAWTARSTPQSPPRTSATGASPTSLHATDGCISTRSRRPDIYTRQCSVDVTVTDLAVMTATLADGGVNPVTRSPRRQPGGMPSRTRRPGDRRTLRAVRGLALRDRAAGQERRQRRHHHRRPRQGWGGHVFARLDAAGNSVRGAIGNQIPVRAPRPEPLRVPAVRRRTHLRKVPPRRRGRCDADANLPRDRTPDDATYCHATAGPQRDDLVSAGRGRSPLSRRPGRRRVVDVSPGSRRASPKPKADSCSTAT